MGLRTAAVVAAVVVLLGGGIFLIARGLSGDDGTPAGAAPTVKGMSAADRAKAERAERARKLDEALKQAGAAGGPEFSVAVLDKKTGSSYAYRGTVKYDTASIVKAQILACMLLKDQDAGRKPTAAEMALATPMIRLSDNDATTALFKRLGGRTAVGKCNKRLGLTTTTVDTAWGLTKTTAADQVRLLAELVDPKGPLTAGSRKTAFTLMNTVDETQDWGVPSVANPGETVTVKNGWDTRTADNGLWAINSIGRVTSPDGKVDVSVAVLSHNNASMESGTALVEKVAKLTRQYLKY